MHVIEVPCAMFLPTHTASSRHTLSSCGIQPQPPNCPLHPPRTAPSHLSPLRLASPQEPYRLSLYVLPRPPDPDRPDPTWADPPPPPPTPPPHRLSHWFGVRDFVVLSPATLSGRVLHADDVAPLSSALFSALAAAGAPWPGFLPVADASRDAWLGASSPPDPRCASAPPTLTRFEADGATGTAVSRRVSSFGLLADLFQERLEGALPGRYEACSTAAFNASAAVQRFYVLPAPAGGREPDGAARRGGGGGGGKGPDAIAERLANWKLERSRGRDDDFGIVLTEWCGCPLSGHERTTKDPRSSLHLQTNREHANYSRRARTAPRAGTTTAPGCPGWPSTSLTRACSSSPPGATSASAPSGTPRPRTASATSSTRWRAPSTLAHPPAHACGVSRSAARGLETLP